jgi:hypothetical protein
VIIERLAEDIAEMRPFLVRNFNPTKALLDLPGELLASFGWDTNNRIGVLRCAEDERTLLELEEQGLVVSPLAITYRGQVTNNVLYWQTVATHDVPLPFPAVSVGRVVLEAIHAKLFSFYDQIDLGAILRQWRAAEQAAPSSAEDEAVVIAASIATGGSAVESGRRAGRIASRLLAEAPSSAR